MYNLGEDGIERMTPEINYRVLTNYPFEATASIEHIEGVLTNKLEKYGVHIEQPFVPTEISIVGDRFPDDSHPIKVNNFVSYFILNSHTPRNNVLSSSGCCRTRSY